MLVHNHSNNERLYCKNGSQDLKVVQQIYLVYCKMSRRASLDLLLADLAQTVETPTGPQNRINSTVVWHAAQLVQLLISYLVLWEVFLMVSQSA